MTKHTILRGTKDEILNYFNQDIKIEDRENLKDFQYEVGKYYDISTTDKNMKISAQLSRIDTEISPFGILFYLYCNKKDEDGTICILTEKTYIHVIK